MPAPGPRRAALAAAAVLLAANSPLARSAAALLREEQVPLSTWQRYIVDNRNDRVKWSCVNWAGAYMDDHVVLGLDRQHIDTIASRIRELGFNCVRLPYSTEGVLTNPAVLDGNLTANPQLQGGKRMLDVFDAAIQALSKQRLMVIINNHNSKSGWCCAFDSAEGLWYTREYNESQWIESLVTLAARYKSNPYVVAFDVRNEPHDYGGVGLTWGDEDPAADWAAAARRAGNAILAVHPDYLIVIEALCLAKELRPLKQHQVELIVPNRVVYEVHAYHYFQMYSMWSDMFMSWLKTRTLIGLVAVIPVVVLALLAWAWHAVDKVWPPPGVLVTSWGTWITACGCGGVVYRTLVWYKMRTTSCAIQATQDQLPDILFWVVFAAAGVGLLICGYRYHFGLRCLKRRFEQCSKQRELSVGKGPQADSVGHGGSQDHSDFLELQSEDDDEDDEEAWECCCRRGNCASRRLAWKGLTTGVPQRAHWDGALCCALQCGIFQVILFVGMVSLYIFAYVVNTYWYFQHHHDKHWGFALIQGHEWTAPVWVGEFGSSAARGDYWLFLMQYMSARDVDWAYWALNPEKPLTEEYRVGQGWVRFDHVSWVNETWSILESDWESVRYPWKMLDLTRIMDSPARWMPQDYPCNRDVYGSECGG